MRVNRNTISTLINNTFYSKQMEGVNNISLLIQTEKCIKVKSEYDEMQRVELIVNPFKVPRDVDQPKSDESHTMMIAILISCLVIVILLIVLIVFIMKKKKEKEEKLK